MCKTHCNILTSHNPQHSVYTSYDFQLEIPKSNKNGNNAFFLSHSNMKGKTQSAFQWQTFPLKISVAWRRGIYSGKELQLLTNISLSFILQNTYWQAVDLFWILPLVITYRNHKGKWVLDNDDNICKKFKEKKKSNFIFTVVSFYSYICIIFTTKKSNNSTYITQSLTVIIL